MLDSELRRRIEILRLEQVPGGEMRAIDLGVTVPFGEIMAALDSRGALHLLVPVSMSEVLSTDRRSIGVAIEPRLLPASSTDPHRVLDLQCLDRDQNDIFAGLASEVAAQLADRPHLSGSIPYRVLDRWRHMFGRAPDATMPRSRLIGLFGELVILREVSRINAESALGIWTGPSNHRHDFTGRTLSLEAKTTEVVESRSVSINGLSQLEPPPESELLLGHVVIESHPQGQNAFQIIDDLVGLGVDETGLNEKLEQARFVRSLGADEHFALREINLHIVDDDFPRVTSSALKGGSLPIGVSDVSYRIDLSLAPGPLDRGEARSAFAALARV